jgi:hypothetical protein
MLPLALGERKWCIKSFHITGTVVEHSTQNTKIMHSNPATGTRREKMEVNFFSVYLYPGSTMVEHSIHNHKIKDLSLDTDTTRR